MDESQHKLIVDVTAGVEWPTPPKDTAEGAQRAQANVKIQAAAHALRPVFTQMLMAVIEASISQSLPVSEVSDEINPFK